MRPPLIGLVPSDTHTTQRGHPPNPMIHEEIFEEQTSESLLALLVMQNHVISHNFLHVLILSRYNLCVAIQPVTPIRNVIQSE